MNALATQQPDTAAVQALPAPTAGEPAVVSAPPVAAIEAAAHNTGHPSVPGTAAVPRTPHVLDEPADTAPAASAWRTVRLSRPCDGPVQPRELEGMATGRVPYTLGLEPQPRISLPGYDSGVMCLLIAVFVLLSSNFRHYSTFFKNFWSDLLSVRRREKAFSVRTFSETGVQTSVILAACLAEGIVLNSALGLGSTLDTVTLPAPLGHPAILGQAPQFLAIGVLTLLALAYYGWQLAAYATVGAVFTDKVSARMWLKGFNASQSLLALLIVPPALTVLFNPSAATAVTAITAGAYVLTRVTFIYKGFRLFYDNFGSLLYFILYLCSLEIAPLVVIYRGMLYAGRLTSLW